MKIVRHLVPEFSRFGRVFVHNELVTAIRYKSTVLVRQAEKGKSWLVLVLILVIRVSEYIIINNIVSPLY